MVINDENCILKLPYNNTTFHLTFIKPFYILDIKLVDIKYYKLKCDIKTDNTIIVDTFKPINTSKCDKGQLYKAFDINIFL